MINSIKVNGLEQTLIFSNYLSQEVSLREQRCLVQYLTGEVPFQDQECLVHLVKKNLRDSLIKIAL